MLLVVKGSKKLSNERLKEKSSKRKAEIMVPKLNILKTSEKSVDTSDINTGVIDSKSVIESKREESIIENPVKAQLNFEPQPEQNQISANSKTDNDALTSHKASTDIDNNYLIMVPKIPDTQTPEITSKKRLSINTSQKIASQDECGSADAHRNDKIHKFKSEAPIKNLLKYDTNSSAINLLSPSHNAAFKTKGVRKPSGHYHGFHQDGASIVSANLSSDMGTACFQGSARRISAASHNESPELHRKLEDARRLHSDPMSFITTFDVIFS